MDAIKAEQLELAIAQLQGRWGSHAICTLREVVAPLEGIPTGFPALDTLTGAGGIPVGYVSALVGQPSSGATSLAYRLAASAQRQLRTVLWLDTNQVFDPASARASRVDFLNLLLNRPTCWEHVLAVTRDVAEQLLHVLIILTLPIDSAPEDVSSLSGLLRVLPAICHRNGNTAVLLHSGPGWSRWRSSIMQRTVTIIEIDRLGWLPGVTGIETRAILLKNKFGPSDQWADLHIEYPELP